MWHKPAKIWFWEEKSGAICHPSCWEIDQAPLDLLSLEWLSVVYQDLTANSLATWLQLCRLANHVAEAELSAIRWQWRLLVLLCLDEAWLICCLDLVCPAPSSEYLQKMPGQKIWAPWCKKLFHFFSITASLASIYWCRKNAPCVTVLPCWLG
jgi:hypothetical protein